MTIKLFGKKRKPVFGTLTLAALLATCSAAANSSDDIHGDAPSGSQQAEHQADLDKLRAVINSLLQELEHARSDKDRLNRQLRDHEKKIGAVARKISSLDRKLAELKDRLAKLVRQEKQLRSDLFQNRHTLRQQIRAAYTIGQQDYIKLLLNQQDPGSIGRMLSYYDYFIRVRADNISNVNEKIARVSQLQLAIEENRQALKQNREQHDRERQSLEQSRQERKLVLARLDREISSKQQKLDKMREDEARLQQLVTRLQNLLPDIPEDSDKLVNFASQKGRLQWPSKGRIQKSFGTSRKSGRLKWQGVVIAASAGSPVRAIAHGQVAFADWLQGYGLLLIIDHGDNYMSLYGFNQSLLKEPGDWIEPGEIIAMAGNSGGHTKPGVYFEIRKDGKPVNPGIWCSNISNKKSARR